MNTDALNLKFADWESLIRHDPGRRGVAGFRVDGRLLGEGQLEAAARDVAANCQAAAIVTGFPVFDGERWTAETDGPPGALFLARALRDLGIEVDLISDALCMPLLIAGCDAWNLPHEMLHEAPNDPAAFETWRRAFWSSPLGQRLTHLIAIERCGPSHVRDEIPPEHRDRCHNMRGVIIDEHQAPVHLLFEDAKLLPLPLGEGRGEGGQRPLRQVTTIGMADGGNEIGMGQFPWETLTQAIAQGPAAQVACRISCDHTLVAGISNWAAYALAVAVCRLRSRSELLSRYDSHHQRRLINALVADGRAVDGVTKRNEATVDGVNLGDYLIVLDRLLLP